MFLQSDNLWRLEAQAFGDIKIIQDPEFGVDGTGMLRSVTDYIRNTANGRFAVVFETGPGGPGLSFMILSMSVISGHRNRPVIQLV